MIRNVSCILVLSKTFIIKGCWNLSKTFSASNEMIMCSFFFQFVYIDGYSYVELSLHLWDEANLIMVNNVSDELLDWVCQDFIEYFCISAHEEDWSVFLLLSCVFV